MQVETEPAPAPEPDTNDTEPVKISILTNAKVPPARYLAQDTTPNAGSIILTVDGDVWFLNSVNPDGGGEGGGGNSKVKTIHAPNLGLLQVVAQLFPVFEDPTPETGGVTSLTGNLGLSASSDDAFPWVFGERDGGVTITALASAIPSSVTLPTGGRVYIVWQASGRVGWQWSGGVVEQVPPNAIWVVETQGKESVGAGDGATSGTSEG